MIQILLHKNIYLLLPPSHRFWNGRDLSFFTHFSARWLNWWLEVDISAIKFGVRDVILVLLLVYFKHLVSCETVAKFVCSIGNNFKWAIMNYKTQNVRKFLNIQISSKWKIGTSCELGQYAAFYPCGQYIIQFMYLKICAHFASYSS